MSLLEATMHSAEAAPCPACGADQVIRRDAIGRTRTRCPKCDRTSLASTYRHPDDAMVPQTLVRAPKVVPLPEIQPGQLRCQLCARGVGSTADIKGSPRLCADCLRGRFDDTRRRPCRGCGASFVPSRKHPTHCGSCVHLVKTKRRRPAHEITRPACACGTVRPPARGRIPSAWICPTCRGS